jgi:hypothetical protein
MPTAFSATDAYVFVVLAICQACVILGAKSFRALNPKGNNRRVNRSAECRVANKEKESNRVRKFIAAAKVERAASADRNADGVTCFSFVHVFSGYVASLSRNYFYYKKTFKERP